MASNEVPMPNKIDYHTCIVPTCKKPLGHDTIEQDYRVCHEHRVCSVCSNLLQPVEIQIAHAKSLESENSIELAHPRCLIASGKLATLEQDPTLSIKQSSYNLLNAARLMVDPDMALSIQTNENNAMLRSREFCEKLVDQMDFDGVYVHLKMLEACVASVNLFIATQDRKAIKQRADLREVEKFKKATQEARTSSRPTNKPSDDSAEVELGKFMELFSIKDRKVALDLKRRRDKSVEAFQKMGMQLELSIQMANKAIEQGREFGKGEK